MEFGKLENNFKENGPDSFQKCHDNHQTFVVVGLVDNARKPSAYFLFGFVQSGVVWTQIFIFSQEFSDQSRSGRFRPREIEEWSGQTVTYLRTGKLTELLALTDT